MLLELSLFGVSSFLSNQRKSIFVKKLDIPNKSAVKSEDENMKLLFVTSAVNLAESPHKHTRCRLLNPSNS